MSPAVGNLAKALSAAQGEMKGAVKDASNPFFKSRYADLSSIKEASQESLTKYGLAIIGAPSAEGAKVSVTTVLMHESGEWISCEVTATAKDESPQSVGSCITYLRRYGIQSILNIASEDDDGEAAQPRPQFKPQPAARAVVEAVVDKESLARKARVDKLKAAKGPEFVQWAETTMGHILPERLSLLTNEQINVLEAALKLGA